MKSVAAAHRDGRFRILNLLNP